MPTKPAPSCLHPGCRSRTSGGAYCDAHKPPEPIENRPSSWARGYDARHRGWRKIVLHRDAVCRACNRAPATVADHIVPITAGGDWSISNGQGLCHSCHQKKTAKDKRHGLTRTCTKG